MRRYGIEEPYEKLKDFSRGKNIDQFMLHSFIRELNIPDEAKNRLLSLHPTKYIGRATKLAKGI